MKYFEDYVVGEEQLATSTYLVTEDEIIEIASRFDPQPFHTAFLVLGRDAAQHD